MESRRKASAASFILHAEEHFWDQSIENLPGLIDGADRALPVARRRQSVDSLPRFGFLWTAIWRMNDDPAKSRNGPPSVSSWCPRPVSRSGVPVWPRSYGTRLH